MLKYSINAVLTTQSSEQCEVIFAINFIRFKLNVPYLEENAQLPLKMTLIVIISGKVLQEKPFLFTYYFLIGEQRVMGGCIGVRLHKFGLSSVHSVNYLSITAPSPTHKKSQIKLLKHYLAS